MASKQYLASKAWIERRKKSGMCLNCRNRAVKGTRHCKTCVEKRSLSRRNKNRWFRDTALNYYGAFCSCCGEKTREFLVFDHIAGNGAEHRKKDPKAVALARWLVTNNFPEGFQVLCWNCNAAKHIYGVCPHKKRPS